MSLPRSSTFQDISRAASADPCQVPDLASKLLATAWNLSPGKRKPKSTAIHPVVPSRSMIEQVGRVAFAIRRMAMVCTYNKVPYFCIHVLSPCHGSELLTNVFLQGNSPFSASSTRSLERQLRLNHYAFIIFCSRTSWAPKRLRWQAYKVGHAWALLHAPSRLAMHQWRPKGRSPSPHQPSLSAPGCGDVSVASLNKVQRQEFSASEEISEAYELCFQLQIWFRMCNQVKIIKLNLFPLHECPDLWVSQEWNSCRHLHLLLRCQVTSSPDFTSEGPKKWKHVQCKHNICRADDDDDDDDDDEVIALTAAVVAAAGLPLLLILMNQFPVINDTVQRDVLCLSPDWGNFLWSSGCFGRLLKISHLYGEQNHFPLPDSQVLGCWVGLSLNVRSLAELRCAQLSSAHATWHGANAAVLDGRSIEGPQIKTREMLRHSQTLVTLAFMTGVLHPLMRKQGRKAEKLHIWWYIFNMSWSDKWKEIELQASETSSSLYPQKHQTTV